jgi:hypothetical protein
MAGEGFFNAGHGLRTSSGETHSFTASYADSSVLFVIPPQFDARRPFDLVVYFHGFWTDISRQHSMPHPAGAPGIWYGLAEQLAASGRNAVLVAPQLPKSAADGHPGKLRNPGGGAAFLKAVDQVLFERFGATGADAVSRAKVVVASFSGGYQAAACLIGAATGDPDRVRAILMIDSLYGLEATFACWIRKAGPAGVFVSEAITTKDHNRTLCRKLGLTAEHFPAAPPDVLAPGKVVVYAPPAVHGDMHLKAPIDGPPAMPLAWFLERLPPLPDTVGPALVA